MPDTPPEPLTAPIPGGTATLRRAGQLTARGRRIITAYVATLGPERLQEIVAADGETTEDLAEEIGLTAGEARLLDELGDAVAWAHLADWTLPEPIPDRPERLRDLASDLRDALQAVTAHEGHKTILAL